VTGPALLGMDLGTSGAKAVLLGADGRLLAEAEAGYPVDSPHPGWAETDPPAWWRAVATAVRAARDRAGGVDVAAVGVDGQMHGLVLTDAAGRPLRPALLWADARAVEETAAWRRLPEPRRAALANPIVPGMTGPLLRWVARHEPRTYQRARWALLAKDWIRHRLTGTAATDPSDASATLLWDLPADRWAHDVAAEVGVEAELLPPVVASAALAGTLRPDAAKALGLRAGIPVAAGAADPAEVQLSVGTGGQIVRPVPARRRRRRPAPISTGPPHLTGGTRWPRSRTPGSPSTGSEGRCRRAGRSCTARPGPARPGRWGSRSSPTSAGSGPPCSGPMPAGRGSGWAWRPTAPRCCRPPSRGWRSRSATAGSVARPPG
jgi:FGGY family of carbohydrate kinases, N-terminal domain